MADSFPRSLPVPAGSVVPITAELIGQAIAASRQSPRGRIVLPLCEGNNDILQRMLNALQPGSYVQPHRHITPPKAESVVVLTGSLGCVTFGEDGQLQQHLLLVAGSGLMAVDIRPGIYHTFFALQPDTVVFEVKPGPYDERLDKHFAPWAPTEASNSAGNSLSHLVALISRQSA